MVQYKSQPSCENVSSRTKISGKIKNHVRSFYDEISPWLSTTNCTYSFYLFLRFLSLVQVVSSFLILLNPLACVSQLTDLFILFDTLLEIKCTSSSSDKAGEDAAKRAWVLLHSTSDREKIWGNVGGVWQYYGWKQWLIIFISHIKVN